MNHKNTNLTHTLEERPMAKELVLDPKNPYFLDTYAHLLYRSGKLKEAVKYQKKAVTELDNKKSNYQIDEIQAETIRADYQKMKTKTL